MPYSVLNRGGNRINGLQKDVAEEVRLKHRCTLGISHYTHTQIHTQWSHSSTCNQRVYTRCQETWVALAKSIERNEKCRDNALNRVGLIIHLIIRRTHTHTHVVSRWPLTRTDRVNGDGDRGVKQKSEIWRQEETESNTRRGGSRAMEYRMKLTDIKTARTPGESFPFLRANIRRLVRGVVGGGGTGAEGGHEDTGSEWFCLCLKIGPQSKNLKYFHSY